ECRVGDDQLQARCFQHGHIVPFAVGLHATALCLGLEPDNVRLRFCGVYRFIMDLPTHVATLAKKKAILSSRSIRSVATCDSDGTAPFRDRDLPDDRWLKPLFAHEVDELTHPIASPFLPYYGRLVG